MVERLSFATAPALYAALWLSGGIILATCNWITPGVLIAGTLLLTLLAVMAARKALRVALLPLACTWLLLGLLLSEIEPSNGFPSPPRPRFTPPCGSRPASYWRPVTGSLLAY